MTIGTGCTVVRESSISVDPELTSILGTGGTAPTISGWLRMNKLRLVTALNYLCGDDLRNASALPGTGPQYLRSLPIRPGGHPLLRPW